MMSKKFVLAFDQGTTSSRAIIFDKKGKLLGDSNIRPEGDGLDKPGKNMGCPASEEEVAAFVTLLKKISKISDTEATAVTERFKKNK